jgi:hypothetical protein
MREALDVAAAENVKPFWARAEEYLDHLRRKQIPQTERHHTSMLDDIERVKKTEINFLNAVFVDLGKKHNITTPVKESIGNFFYSMENFFGAADAYEHAAEIILLAGKDISDYEVLVDAWRKNYEYWKEQGEMDDAEWSLKRIDSYRTSQNKV